MSGMNPGFAAYLAAKKAKKGMAAPSVTPPVLPSSKMPNTSMAGLMPFMAPPVKGAPKGKRHSKITHVSTAHKKGK